MADNTPINGRPLNKIVAYGSWSKGGTSPRPAVPLTPLPTPNPNAISGLIGKAKSAIDSYASRGVTQNKRVNEAVKQVRMLSCHGNPELGIPPCQGRKESVAEAGRYFCGECGCGDRAATWLNNKTAEDYTKLDFPRVACPMNMPGFTNHIERSKETVERCMKYDFTRKEQIERHIALTIKQTNAPSV